MLKLSKARRATLDEFVIDLGCDTHTATWPRLIRIHASSSVSLGPCATDARAHVRLKSRFPASSAS